MYADFFTLGLVMLLGAMLPGADFAVVTKNALLYSRRAGINAAFGIVAAMCIHMSYCVLGFAVVIHQSPWLFRTIQYAGAAYLFYMATMLLKPNKSENIKTQKAQDKQNISHRHAFREGFVCNLLNPKATLFFLTIFSVISAKQTNLWLNAAYAIEMLLIALIWFCLLAYLISHERIICWLNRSQKAIEKILGIILFILAIFTATTHQL